MHSQHPAACPIAHVSTNCDCLVLHVQGDEVKKGQTLAYVEQLGTFVPVEVCHSCCTAAQLALQHAEFPSIGSLALASLDTTLLGATLIACMLHSRCQCQSMQGNVHHAGPAHAECEGLQHTLLHCMFSQACCNLSLVALPKA